MSTVAYETPAQYERDLRSANVDSKRRKDSSAKWAWGQIPVPGVQWSATGQVVNNATEAQLAHSRPSHHPTKNPIKKDHNIVKMRDTHERPVRRVKGKGAAHEEMSASWGPILDLVPFSSIGPHAASARKGSVSDNTLYSFDRDNTPGAPLPLDAFVKEAPRATERQVEREYEVLDHNGEVLRGRKARQNLRKSPNALGASAVDKIIIEDDGFELV
ncbi:hypothetical protein GQ53DRAFT_187166 [Thozetella sp. PMI_491]|nr:hypothetical protein GQ53DRAFT_187166 [Thozetella sp. PMI_491]